MDERCPGKFRAKTADALRILNTMPRKGTAYASSQSAHRAGGLLGGVVARKLVTKVLRSSL